MAAAVAFDANRFDPAAIKKPNQRNLLELAGLLSHRLDVQPDRGLVLEKGLSRCDFPRTRSLMFRGAARVSFVLAGLVLAACAEPDSDTAKYSAASFYGPHYSFTDYGRYGTHAGFRNPTACWRSSWRSSSLECPGGQP